MPDSPLPRVQIDGQPATAGQLTPIALGAFGHFTAMQVRDHRVRGLALHLRRLDAANRELFGAGLDGERVRALIRQALGHQPADASVRVHVQQPDPGTEPTVMVIIRPPGELPGAPHRLKSVPYQRSLAHLKHIGDFGQSYYRALALRAGFDEALLTGPGGVISEGAHTNVGFFDGNAVLWPDAPMLAGTTLQLIEAGLATAGLPSRREPVRLDRLGAFRAAFLASSRGITPIGQIDEQPVPVDPELMRALASAIETAPWDQI